MKPFTAFLLILAILLSALLLLGHPAVAETVYVSIREGTYLNGREHPSTRSHITMRLFNGDALEIVSFDGEWVEVEGGESGTSFVKAEYLSEVNSPVSYTNTSGGRVRVRRSPSNSTAIDWIRSGETIAISKVIAGWGYTHGGWVDLSFFEAK